VKLSTIPEKARLSFEVPKKVRDQLDDLVSRSSASSFTEVVRKALALYDLVLEHSSEGGDVVLRDKNGREEIVKLL
jgi:hypothetical protein